MISLIMILRSYLGLSQLQLAHHLDISVGTLQRLEQGGAHGTLETYLRLSDLWGIPVDALLANDFTLIPADFFQRHPVPKEKTIATDEPSIIGFRGEQLILAQERARVAQEHPNLLPLVRRTADYPRLSGYDILSFDCDGIPMSLEVKSSIQEQGGFKMSANECETAERMIAQNGQYWVILIQDLDSNQPKIQRMTYQHLLATRCKSMATILAVPKCPPKTEKNNIARYRERLGIPQSDFAGYLGCSVADLLAYERDNAAPSAQMYLTMATILGVPVDDLLMMEVPHNAAHC